jgi:ABC-type multidrug transport system fused ATPase/permease subunit
MVLSETNAFSISRPSSSALVASSFSSTALNAAKKKVKAASAALDALEKLEQSAALLDAPLSLKELKELEKKQKQIAKQQQTVSTVVVEPSSEKKKAEAHSPSAPVHDHVAAIVDEPKPLTKMEKMLLREQQADKYHANVEANSDPDEPSLSKKELKELKKKQEKEALRLERKAAKKLQNIQGVDDDASDGEDDASGATATDYGELDLEYNDDDNQGEGEYATTVPGSITLEDKIRKERPPPRIRVMESSQPGYTSLRLENVGIMFRNQAVLKDVTWGVQTGDRIGLVGANGTCVLSGS